MKSLNLILSVLLVLPFISCSLSGKTSMVLIEAESFDDYGGWILDGQFVDQMGSSYLMAHGIGIPVKNARTAVMLPDKGNYKVFVRTMNWVPGYLPGEFEINIEGEELKGFLRPTNGRNWNWYEAGSFQTDKKKINLELKDKTGFNGRCDAILLVKDAAQNYTPPNDPEQLTNFRNKLLNINKNIENQGEFDMVVIGGGFAGICVSVSAARLGVKVALIQNRPVLGGNASSEIKVSPIGKTMFPPYPRNADVVNELLDVKDQRTYSNLGAIDDKRLNVVLNEPNIHLYLNTHANEVVTKKSKIVSINAIDIRTNQKFKFEAPLFVDCTGDGTIGYLAGAEYRMGREGQNEFNESLAPLTPDSLLMGNTQYWYATEETEKSDFPKCSWALAIEDEKMYQVSTPRWPMKLVPGIIASSAWNWESGFNKNTIDEAEFIRDHNLRAIFGVWDFLKNKSLEKQKYAKGKLQWVASVLGKRESRRLMGDVLLTQNDIMNKKEFPDGCVTTTWYFDLHYPHPQNSKYFPGEEFRSVAYDDPNWEIFKDNFPGKYIKIDPYLIPFRCLYSQNIQNLMMAGRNISVTHAALATTRVMQTCGMMGTVVGRAAYILKKHGDLPETIYSKHLEEFKSLLLNPHTF